MIRRFLDWLLARKPGQSALSYPYELKPHERCPKCGEPLVEVRYERVDGGLRMTKRAVPCPLHGLPREGRDATP